MGQENSKKNNEDISYVLYTKHVCVVFHDSFQLHINKTKVIIAPSSFFYFFSFFFGKSTTKMEILEIELNFYAILVSNIVN